MPHIYIYLVLFLKILYIRFKIPTQKYFLILSIDRGTAFYKIQQFYYFHLHRSNVFDYLYVIKLLDYNLI